MVLAQNRYLSRRATIVGTLDVRVTHFCKVISKQTRLPARYSRLIAIEDTCFYKYIVFALQKHGTLSYAQDAQSLKKFRQTFALNVNYY